MKYCVFHLLLGILFFSTCTSPKKEIAEPFLFEYVVPSKTNILFDNSLPESDLMNSFIYEYFYNGGGIAVGDLNNDGLEDVFFTSNLSENQLYLNKGDLEFQNITLESNVGGKQGWTTGVSMVDINADGLLDIYVCYSGPYKESELRKNELFINLGTNAVGIPSFENQAEKYNLADSGYSIQAAYLDYDLDGDLDVYLMNHNPNAISSQDLYANRLKKSPLGDKFYENKNGFFVDVTTEANIYSNAISYGLGIGVGDLNNDGWPDIYISNDYGEHDYMYLNQKNKSFREEIKTSTRHISNFSMGNDIADYDNDGYLDIMVLDMVAEDNYGIKTSMPSMSPRLFEERVAEGFHHQYMYNTLQHHTSYSDEYDNPQFEELGQMAGVSSTGWSWAPLMVDFDNDGLKDLFISNGIKRDFRNNDFKKYLTILLSQDSNLFESPSRVVDLVNKIPQKPLNNYFFRNNGNISFTNKTSEWLPFQNPSYSNGAAYGDFDNDGDLDLLVNNIDQYAFVLKNNSRKNHVKLKLKGGLQNPGGIGAKIDAWIDGERQYFENYTVRGYLSSVSTNIIIGLNTAKMIDSLIVTWPLGASQKILGIDANKTVVLNRKNAKEFTQTTAIDSSYFRSSNVLSLLKHRENDFDDFDKQALLPHKLSQQGPALAVSDMNNDGMDDLYLGQSSGNVSELYQQNSDGSLKLIQNFTEVGQMEEVDAQFFDYDNDGDLDLYVVTGGNEFSFGNLLYSDILYENIDGKLVNVSSKLPKLYESGSSVQIYDYNKDSYLDLLVTTKHIPGKYPKNASSYLLKNENGTHFVDVTKEMAPDLVSIGMVSDAQWTDFDADGDIDMILVGEWMSPVFLENTKGHFDKKIFPKLDSLSGWYFSIEAHDLDNDGDLDYVLGNLGKNYKYKASSSEPFEVYSADFDRNGNQDIVLGYYNFGKLFPLRGKECSSEQIPSLTNEFSSYHQFGSVLLNEVYNIKDQEDMLNLKAYNFSNGILKNNGDNFEFIPFDPLAQTSSINDILLEDINNDGLIDLVLAGNLYDSEIETPRNDASHGYVLLNKGNCTFESVNAQLSGLYIEGETKKLKKINIKGVKYMMAGINNGKLILHTINRNQ